MVIQDANRKGRGEGAKRAKNTARRMCPACRIAAYALLRMNEYAGWQQPLTRRAS